MITTQSISSPALAGQLLDDAKRHLVIQTAAHDERIKGYIQTAVDLVGKWCNRCLEQTTVIEAWCDFPDTIELARSPLVSITSVSYYDESNVNQTLAVTTDYWLFSPANYPAQLTPVNSWPAVYDRPDAVRVQYIAGWTSSTLPAAAKHAIRLLVAHWNAERSPEVVGTISSELQIGLQAVLSGVRYANYV